MKNQNKKRQIGRTREIMRSPFFMIRLPGILKKYFP